MKLKLTYTDIATKQLKEIVVNTPVVIGSNTDKLPKKIDEHDVTHVLIFDFSIAPYHALIEERKEKIAITDRVQDCPIGVSKNRFKVGAVEFNFELLKPELVIAGTNSINLNHTDNDSNICQKMVGFLFKRPCNRTSRINCPHCNNLGDDLDDYAADYIYYENYGDYSGWGNTYYRDRHSYSYDRDNRRVEFTEADNVAFEEEGDRDFESDYSAS